MGSGFVNDATAGGISTGSIGWPGRRQSMPSLDRTIHSHRHLLLLLCLLGLATAQVLVVSHDQGLLLYDLTLTLTLVVVFVVVFQRRQRKLAFVVGATALASRWAA